MTHLTPAQQAAEIDHLTRYSVEMARRLIAIYAEQHNYAPAHIAAFTRATDAREAAQQAALDHHTARA